MNPLTITPPELVLPVLRTGATERLASLGSRPHGSLRRRVGRMMVTWGARLDPSAVRPVPSTRRLPVPHPA